MESKTLFLWLKSHTQGDASFTYSGHLRIWDCCPVNVIRMIGHGVCSQTHPPSEHLLASPNHREDVLPVIHMMSILARGFSSRYSHIFCNNWNISICCSLLYFDVNGRRSGPDDVVRWDEVRTRGCPDLASYSGCFGVEFERRFLSVWA